MVGISHIERIRSISFKLSHECAKLDASACDKPWSRADLVEYICSRTVPSFGKAVMDVSGQTVLGYMAYGITGGVISVGRLVVHPDHRNAGVATAMLDRLKEKVGHNGILRIRIDTTEDNVAMQCCLQKSGFTATEGYGCLRAFFFEA